MLPGDVYYFAPNSSVLCLQREDVVQAPSSPKNLNPAAPVFRQGGQDKGRNSFSTDLVGSEKDYGTGVDAGQSLTNGDVNHSGNGPGGYPGMAQHRGPYSARSQQTSLGSNANTLGINHPMAAGAGIPVNQTNHQAMAAHQQQQFNPMVADPMRQQQARGGEHGDSQASSQNGSGEDADAGADSSSSAGGGNDGEGVEEPVEELQYPDEVIAPIRKQLEYYFSQENLPNDKYINNHMDAQKFVPLSLFPQFNRMKPICSNVEQLVQAVKTSSILELNEDKTRVRISQTRKTLTLRGLPPNATADDIRRVLEKNECSSPTHVEVIMVQTTVSNWYVSFSTEAQCLDAFFKLHESKVSVDGYVIGCCIKSSGTHVASGYFPSQDENQHRRIVPNQAAAAPAQSTIANQQPPQQQPALFNAMPLHPSLMQPTTQNLFYNQGQLQYNTIPYNIGMIAQWPSTAGLDPGLVLQNSGLQPQQIRPALAARPHVMPSGPQQRFSSRPPRPNARQNLDRNSAHDRTQVSVSSVISRNSPRNSDVTASASVVAPNAFMSRRSNVRDDVSIAVGQQAPTQHQPFLASVGGQHQQVQATSVPATTSALVNTPVLDVASSMVNNPVNVAAQHFSQQQTHHHPQPLMVQPSQATSNPPPLTQQHHPHPHHHQHPHPHHHQPPPPMHHQPSQPTHHLQHQQPQTHPHSHGHSVNSAAGHQHSQQQQQQHVPTHQQPIPPQHQQPPPPPPVSHHQSQPNHHHPHHAPHHQPQHPHHPHHPQHGMMPHHQQPHPHHPHQMPPPPPTHHHHHHHSASLSGGRSDATGNRRNNRKRREDNGRNQRGDRNLRANFSSQAPAAADNFTMEANSFPPLPGAASNPTLETAPETRMTHSDIVKGFARVSMRGNVSSTPSPVATPTSHLMAPNAGMVDMKTDDVDSAVEDDTTSSSQEEVDLDAGAGDANARTGRPESSSLPEPSAVPTQSRSVKASVPPNNLANSTHKHTDAVMRQNPNPSQMQARPQAAPQQLPHQNQQQQQQQQQVSALVSPVSPAAPEPPKLSYAQILKEAANNNAAAAAAAEAAAGLTAPPSSATTGTAPAMSNPPANGASTQAPTHQGYPHAGRNNQLPNTAFREQGNYTHGQGQRSMAQRPPKDGMPRTDGPMSRVPNGKRNAKENRASNKFDRRKPEGRPK